MTIVQRIRLGIIGTGFIVERIIDASKLDPRIRICAIYSRSEEKADEFAKRNNIPHTFTSLENMASSHIIDAVYIASPNALHASQSILFMQHGKHVLCEKAFASNANEVHQMIAASQKNNVTLMEAMKSTLIPNFQEIFKHLKHIGKVRRYFASYCQYSSRYDKFKDGIVLNAFNPDLSNGAIMDIGVYTIYPMVILFGKPRRINAMGLKLSNGVDGEGVINFEYEDLIATVLYSKITDSFLPSEIQGEDGTIIIDRIDSVNNAEVKYRNSVHQIISNTISDNAYYYELKEFADLIIQGQRESKINSHQNSLITIEIVDEVRRQLGITYPADI